MPLKKKLNLLHVFCIATGAMISSGLSILPGIAHARAGPAVILSYLPAGVLALPGMLSLAEMTSAMPKAGGECFTILSSLGTAVGTVVGLLSWFSLATKSAFALIGLSTFSVLLVDINPRIIAVVFYFLFFSLESSGGPRSGKDSSHLRSGTAWHHRSLPGLRPPGGENEKPDTLCTVRFGNCFRYRRVCLCGQHRFAQNRQHGGGSEKPGQNHSLRRGSCDQFR